MYYIPRVDAFNPDYATEIFEGFQVNRYVISGSKATRNLSFMSISYKISPFGRNDRRNIFLSIA
jgi:hypothetical protein